MGITLAKYEIILVGLGFLLLVGYLGVPLAFKQRLFRRDGVIFTLLVSATMVGLAVYTFLVFTPSGIPPRYSWEILLGLFGGTASIGYSAYLLKTHTKSLLEG